MSYPENLSSSKLEAIIDIFALQGSLLKLPRCHSAAKVSVSNRANKANKMDLQHSQGCAEEFGRTEPFDKYIMDSMRDRGWKVGAMELVKQIVRCPEGPGVEDDVLMKTAMNGSRSR